MQPQIITVDVANKLAASPTKSQESAASAQNAPSQDDSEDSVDGADPPTIGEERAKDASASDEDESDDESDDSSDDDSNTDTTSASKPSTTKATDNDDSESESDDRESEDIEDDKETTLDDEMKASSDDQSTTPQPSSNVTTQDATALAANGSGLDDSTPSSLLQFGYLIMSSCAMIIVLTLAYLYRRVFRRARQPYMNISSLEQPTRVTINNFDDEDYDVDDNESDDEDVSQGPRIPRHAQSSRSVM